MGNSAAHLRIDGFGHLDDDELYAMIGSGDSTAGRAFTELYSRHSGRMYAYCRCLSWDEDECNDIFQESFARFYESGLQRREIRNPAGYLFRIARNLAFNLRRDRKPTVPLHDDLLSNVDASHERTEMLQLIRMAMDLLPDDYREAFFLREFSDLPYKEIAGLMGISQVNVRIRVTRAREKIRSILHPYIVELQ